MLTVAVTEVKEIVTPKWISDLKEFGLYIIKSRDINVNYNVKYLDEMLYKVMNKYNSLEEFLNPELNKYDKIAYLFTDENYQNYCGEIASEYIWRVSSEYRNDVKVLLSKPSHDVTDIITRLTDRCYECYNKAAQLTCDRRIGYHNDELALTLGAERNIIYYAIYSYDLKYSGTKVSIETSSQESKIALKWIAKGIKEFMERER